MPLIIHIFRVPRYQNIFTGEYETLPFEDLQIVNKYFNWKKARANGVACDSLKDWCGVREEDMPHKGIVNYYGDFYNRKPIYDDYTGELEETESIFEDLARLVKMNQLANWMMKHVTNGVFEKDFWYEVSGEQLKDLCARLKRTRRCLSVVEDELIVKDKWLAKELMPLMDEVPAFWGTDAYDRIYAEQIARAYETIREILNSTDFEKESIYFVIC